MAKTFEALAKRVMTRPQRERARQLARQDLVRVLLSEARKRRGMSQRQLADLLGIRQPSLSKLENQDDMQVSTLRRIVEALGGQLVITARFPEGLATITQFDEARDAAEARPRAARPTKARTVAGPGSRARPA